MADGSSTLPVYQALGVRYLQLSLPWSAVAPSRPKRPTDPTDPAYVWPSSLDSVIERARKRGIRIALMVASSPAWANGGRSSEWAPRNRAFADFLTAAARRYPGVRHWMIWGEPNRKDAFRPLPANRRRGPRRYATLLRAGYRALKAVSPRNVVIGGMSFTYGEVRPREWARWMRLPNGKPAPLDWYGHNPFSVRFPILRYGPRPEAPGVAGTSATWTPSTANFATSTTASTRSSGGGGRSSRSRSSRSRRIGATMTSTTTCPGAPRPAG